MKQFSSFFLFIFLVLAVAAGCSLTRSDLREKTPVALSNETIAVIYGYPENTTLRSRATVTIRQYPDLYQSHRVALAVQPPSNLRVEALPSFGIADFFFTLTDDEFKAFIPGRGRIYTGKATRELLFSFFKLDLDPAEVVALVAGRAPPPEAAGGQYHLQSYRSDQGGYRLEAQTVDGRPLQSIGLDKTRRMQELEVFDHRGRLRYRVDFTWQEIEPSEFGPRHITVTAADLLATRVEFLFDSPSFSPDIPSNLFDLAVPPGVEVVPVD